MRREFPAKVRKAVFARANGVCEGCQAALKQGEGDVDHVLPCSLGGEPILANAQLLCRVCHKEKSAIDLGRTRKADRQRNIHTGVKKASGTFPKPIKEQKTRKEPLAPRALYRTAQ